MSLLSQDHSQQNPKNRICSSIDVENESRTSYHYNSKDRMVNDISANDTWRHSSNFETLVWPICERNDKPKWEQP